MLWDHASGKCICEMCTMIPFHLRRPIMRGRGGVKVVGRRDAMVKRISNASLARTAAAHCIVHVLYICQRRHVIIVLYCIAPVELKGRSPQALQARPRKAQCSLFVTLAIVPGLISPQIRVVTPILAGQHNKNPVKHPAQRPWRIQSKGCCKQKYILQLTSHRYEYVKNFEQTDVLLPSTWIVVRIDGRGFHK